MIKTKYPLAVVAGLSLIGSLAACSTPGGATAPDGDTDSDAGSGPADTSAEYTDGTYSATADYQAPSGTETVDVTITLADDVITAVEVVGHATDPQAKIHQGQFIDGIAGVVVGKDIDSIQVDKVGGSSLTSGGFNRAVETIRADAAA